MKSILVPVDFGKNSTAACLYAIEIAKTLSARILLIHVFEKPVLLARSYRDALHTEAVEKMKKLITKIKKDQPQFEAEYFVVQGKRNETIIAYAHDNNINLIIMGTSGYGPLARKLLGNPSLSVLRNAPCMVMTVPPQAHFKGLKKIVYATDLSATSLKKAEKIIPFAQAFNSEIIFLYVSLILGKEINVDMQEVTRKIKSTVKYPKISGYVCDDLNADEGIMFFLNKMKADCLILYASHHTMLQKLFHRSVIKSLSLHTNLPLLVIHENDIFTMKKSQSGSKVISKSDISTN